MTGRGDEVAINLEARLSLAIEVDHDHGDGRLVPMIEQAHRADLPADTVAARVYYRCPDCGHSVSVRAVAQSGAAELALETG